MTQEQKLALKKDRLSKLQNSGKENFGVQRKLARQIRNMESK